MTVAATATGANDPSRRRCSRPRTAATAPSTSGQPVQKTTTVAPAARARPSAVRASRCGVAGQRPPAQPGRQRDRDQRGDDVEPELVPVERGVAVATVGVEVEGHAGGHGQPVDDRAGETGGDHSSGGDAGRTAGGGGEGAHHDSFLSEVFEQHTSDGTGRGRVERRGRPGRSSRPARDRRLLTGRARRVHTGGHGRRPVPGAARRPAAPGRRMGACRPDARRSSPPSRSPWPAACSTARASRRTPTTPSSGCCWLVGPYVAVGRRAGPAAPAQLDRLAAAHLRPCSRPPTAPSTRTPRGPSPIRTARCRWGLPATWVASMTWLPSLLLLVLVLPPLYPTGRPPSRFWVWHLRCALTGDRHW